MANIKISELNELETKNSEDLLAIVDTNNNETKKIKVETLAPENFELELIADEEPQYGALVQGECYYNTTTNKIYRYVGGGVYLDLGEPKTGILYIIFSDKATFAYDGETMVSVGGGSGSEIVIGDESEATEDTKLLVDTSGTTDTLKYKDNNSFTELQIKALDSMPVGTEVDFDGTSANIPTGWEQVSGKNYVAYELYSDASGTTGTITLSDSAVNYKCLELFYRNDVGYNSSVRVYDPNGKIVNCSIIFQENNNYMWLYSSMETISGTTITPSNGGIVSLITTGTHDTNNRIYITKVIGYKEV